MPLPPRESPSFEVDWMRFRRRCALLAILLLNAAPIFALAQARLTDQGVPQTIIRSNKMMAAHAPAFVAGGVVAGALVFIAMMLWGRSLRDRALRQTGELHKSLEKQAEQAGVLARAKLEASTRARQQATIASLGQRALAGIDVQLLIDQAVSGVCNTLQVVAAGVFESSSDGTSLLLQAGHGWKEAHVGQTRIAGDISVYPGRVLTAEGVDIPSGWVDPLFDREMLTTGAAVRIPGLPKPFGILLVGDRGDRTFSRDDLHFLHAVANVIGAAFERVRAEDERRRLEAHMQHVQKLESLGVLAGGIAHDFNNLLVGILGNASLAMSEAAPDSPARERLKQIETAAQRAADLTNQMLAYSGKGRFVVERIDLSELVDDTANLLRTAVSKKAELELALDRKLPAFDGDAGQIRQVMMNLITNASDAVGEKGGRIQVATGRCCVSAEYLADAVVGSDRPAGEFVFAEVRDDGCGMDGATMARIFDPFFTTKFTGRGLGLAAVLGIVRGHGGAIRIASAPGQGTTFRVLLPPAKAAALHMPKVQPNPAKPAAGCVLVVDDEPAVRRVAFEVLARAGFEVHTACDGEEALELVRMRVSEFQAVLLDMTMPRMNGGETLKAMRSLSQELGVVLTSGYTEQEAVAQFGIDGFAGFVQKPFLPSTLVTTMRNAVERSVVSSSSKDSPA